MRWMRQQSRMPAKNAANKIIVFGCFAIISSPSSSLEHLAFASLESLLAHQRFTRSIDLD
jgi:hypothetical protein